MPLLLSSTATRLVYPERRMNPNDLSEYFRKIGAKGGAASRRKLTAAQARAMAKKSATARRRKAKARKKERIA